MAKTEQSKELTVPQYICSGVGIKKIAAALPRENAESFARHIAQVGATTWYMNPMLHECTKESFLGAVVQCAQFDLEPNNQLGQAYIVPYENKKESARLKRKVVEAQLQIGYKGLILLAHRSPDVLAIDAHEVWEGDEFDYQFGTGGFVRHRPAFRDPEKPFNEREGVSHFWAGVHLRGGAYKFDVMFAHEIWSIERRYSKASYTGRPWEANPYEMGKKTVIRRLLKTCPLTVNLAQAVDIDEATERGESPPVHMGTAEIVTPEGSLSDAQIEELEKLQMNGDAAESFAVWMNNNGYDMWSDIPAARFDEAKEACRQ